ncbi:hypothetical protein BDW68DRAFT_147321 [Aspergillus falconensis]
MTGCKHKTTLNHRKFQPLIDRRYVAKLLSRRNLTLRFPNLVKQDTARDIPSVVAYILQCNVGMSAPSPIVDRYLTSSAKFKPFYTSSPRGGFFVLFCAHLLFFLNIPHFSILTSSFLLSS